MERVKYTHSHLVSRVDHLIIKILGINVPEPNKIFGSLYEAIRAVGIELFLNSAVVEADDLMLIKSALLDVKETGSFVFQ